MWKPMDTANIKIQPVSLVEKNLEVNNAVHLQAINMACSMNIRDQGITVGLMTDQCYGSESSGALGKILPMKKIKIEVPSQKAVSEDNLAILLTTPPNLPDKRNAYRGPKKALTLGERMTVIKLNEEGKSTRQIAQLLGVGRTQIQLTLKRKQEYINNFNQNAPLEQRRQMRKTGNESVNELCWRWYQEMSRRNIKVNGPMLKERALNFATESGIKTFKASNGWLESFARRHNIVFGKPASEGSSADPSVVIDWKKKVKSLCEGYEDKDVFNLDETGLFFRMTADKSFYVKGQQCPTGSKAIDRLTVMLCTNMLGEKETAVVIGNMSLSKNFKDMNIQLIPVDFKFSHKAWMSSDIFIAWLTGFNNKMALQQRHVILFLDNAYCHQFLQLSNIKLQYLPPNISIVLQPLHQGVMQDFKRGFRRKQLSALTGEMEAHPHVTASELMKTSDIIDTLYWIASAWNDIPETTIKRCFFRCGFGMVSDSSNITDVFNRNDLLNPPEFDRISSELIGGTFTDLCVVDDNLAICDMNVHHWVHHSSDYSSTYQAVEQDRDSEDDTIAVDIRRRPTFADANDALRTLCKYAQCQGLNQIVDQVFMIQESLVIAKCNQRQRTIDEFLKSYI
ncbi:unnamed protein product [Lymnaea stagnalis]|uniref:HTH CENPB-type domain-containing protein n=1 Tax=Lymnaea stagnalis TaxID=6523 RepID=A0AAV2IKZ1_LYMST